MKRRQLLLGAGALLSSAYAFNRGLRYPPLSFDPPPLATQLENDYAAYKFDNMLAVELRDLQTNSFRSYAPEFSLIISPKSIKQGNRLDVQLHNVIERAELEIEGPKGVQVDEEIKGSKRSLSISKLDSDLKLIWRLKEELGTRFAIIGDTGADQELDVCLLRAQQAGAEFLLHLGDFNYVEGEYEMAVAKMSNAKVPCYVSIGNHDFHHNGIIYQMFREQLGPMNHQFELGGFRFVNLDTAADYFPAGSGERGRLMRRLRNDPMPQIIFTHRPLRDPRPHDDHEIGGLGEIPWLIDAIEKSGGGIFLNGHVHHSSEFEVGPLRQYTVGEGLGHEDLVLQRKVARFLMGEIQAPGEVKFEWLPLDMPWSAHLSGTHLEKLIRDGRHRQANWYKQTIL